MPNLLCTNHLLALRKEHELKFFQSVIICTLLKDRNILPVLRIGVSGIAQLVRASSAGVLFPARARDFSLLDNVQTGFQAHQASYPVATGSFFPICKAAGE
jgi:hypothetical protein